MNRPEDALRSCWLALCQDGPGNAPATVRESTIDDVLARYGEPHRRYHTIEHVAAVLDHADRLVDLYPAVARGVVRTAALFHDVVYDPLSSTNEADSADYAVAALGRLGWTTAHLDRVAELIRATSSHTEPGNCGLANVTGEVTDLDVVLDADLAILGASPAKYAKYADDVRYEYGHVTPEQWTVGRAAILDALANQPSIYRTPMMVAEREAQARSNLARERASLESRSSCDNPRVDRSMVDRPRG